VTSLPYLISLTTLSGADILHTATLPVRPRRFAFKGSGRAAPIRIPYGILWLGYWCCYDKAGILYAVVFSGRGSDCPSRWLNEYVYSGSI
jgi:hypothetical protein